MKAIEVIAAQLEEEKPGNLAILAASRIIKRLEESGFEIRHYPLSTPSLGEGSPTHE